MAGTENEYGNAILWSLGEDPTALTETPPVMLELLRYNWALTRVALLFKGVELVGTPEFIVNPRVNEVFDKDDEGELTIPTGRYVQAFGWHSMGTTIGDESVGRILAETRLRDAFLAEVSS